MPRKPRTDTNDTPAAAAPLSPTTGTIDNARVFISSINKYRLQAFPGDRRIFSDIRKSLRKKIEERFAFLTVDINEEWAAAGRGAPRETTERRARQCHIFLGILLDSTGYVDKDGLSATQIEFDAAYAARPDKMLVFIQKSLMDGNGEIFRKQPEEYRKMITDLRDYRDGKIVNEFETWEELEQKILLALDRYCADMIRALHRVPAYTSDKTDEEIAWELMTFTQRHQVMRASFRKIADDLTLPSKVLGGLRPIPTSSDPDRYDLYVSSAVTNRLPILLSACPDRFSYPDAAKFVGYPFRTRVEDWADEIGPLDLILLYHNITDLQIRRHLGNPDIHVSRENWGYFAVDPERFIQAVYLTKCESSHDLDRQLRRFLVWLEETRQIPQLLKRAKARGRILKARPSSRERLG